MRPSLWTAPAFLTCMAAAAAEQDAAPRSYSSYQEQGLSRRQEIFEFVQKPKVTRSGDQVTITFESKGFCDATVAIEDPQKRILRHLASGVLGPLAPEPFQKNALKQTLVWDGKDEQGAYVDAVDSLTVRVSLGLKAQYERNLMWCPKKRGPTADSGLGTLPMLLVASPEGVYAFDGEAAGEHLSLYDHEGNYIRTVFPFPADKVREVRGLKVLPDREAQGACPLRWNFDLVSMLTTAHEGYGGPWPFSIGSHNYGMQTLALAVHGQQLVLGGWRLNRLATDGTSGGMEFSGPRISFDAKLRYMHEFPGGIHPVGPRSAAIDPKGGWLYLTGYVWSKAWNQSGLNGVVRMRLDGQEPPQPFAGTMEQEKFDVACTAFGTQPYTSAGKDDAHLCIPLDVTCDAEGRVYVCDYMNDRIQVFSPEGKVLKSLATPGPVRAMIHPNGKELWVCSWVVGNDYYVAEYADAQKKFKAYKQLPATLTRYEMPDWAHSEKAINPKKLEAYPLPLEDIPPAAGSYMAVSPVGLQARVTVDFWAKEPLLWISEGKRGGVTWNGNVRIFALRGGKLELVRDFTKEVQRDDPQPRTPYHGRQRLYFDPRNEKLYVGEQFPEPLHIKSFFEAIKLDPDSGKGEIVTLPFDTEDMAFDMEGHAYLRTMTKIVRYDARSWREVPFDYGQEEEKLTYSGSSTGRAAPQVLSAIACRLEGNSSSQFYGMWVSPKGNISITGCHRNPAADRKDEKNTATAGVERYEPQIYPGRPWGSFVHIFDKYGKQVLADALPGSNYFQGIAMDRDDNLYIQHSGLPPLDGKFPPNVHRGACTLIKLRTNGRFVAAEGGIIPLPPASRPGRAVDFLSDGAQGVWLQRAEWLYGGVGLSTKGLSGPCHCFGSSRFAFDYFARSVVSELDRYRLSVLDSNGNVILRIGRYGNVDDGKPLVSEKASPVSRALGGDEVALMQALYLATQTDRRIFVADIGNYRILSIKLGYHTEEVVSLKDVKDVKAVGE